MSRINLTDLYKLLSTNVLEDQTCIELHFGIDGDEIYEDCWMGKMPSKLNENQSIYWYGLVADGSQAYDFTGLEDIINAPVFKGKCILEVIDHINWYSLNGLSVEKHLNDFIL